MQFKHPELLYALFLLLIPIIVHLFHLRKFQKVDFTNVAFLKEATLQTRKSSQIKKWLILCTRLLLLAALVFAFAQPFISKLNTFKVEKETVIYLDNSYSMQAKGDQGELLKRAVQDIINNVPEDETFSMVTNNEIFKNTTIDVLKNDLLKLGYSANKTSHEAALMKSQTQFSNKKGIKKHLIYISDFQQDESEFKPKTDSFTKLHLVKLLPINKNNIALDDVFISETTPTTLSLKVTLKNSGSPLENLPISLYNGNDLIAKTSVLIDKTAETTFSLPANQVINGKLSIDDSSLQFDNTLYFNINVVSKINILVINASDDSYLKRIYTPDEFNYISALENQLNYNSIDQQHLIILNELNNIPVALVSALKQYIGQGGSLIVIPSTTANTLSYNKLLANYGAQFLELTESDKRITSINYSHPLYNSGVFEKQVKNFQYPKVTSFYGLTSNNFSAALQFEDGKHFLTQQDHVYVFSAALNADNSNFQNSPLIVPTFYNMGKRSYKIPALCFTIGKDNAFEVETQMQQDAVLSLQKEDINIIPRQQYFNSKVRISTADEPSAAGIYTIMNKDERIKNVSYNFSRDESILEYSKLTEFENTTISNSISDIFNSIKSDTKINALWKWFVIFALALLIIEMLILKFFK